MVANILTPLGPFPPSFPRSPATYISMWQSTPDVAGTRPRGEADRARHRRRFADCRCCRIKTRFGCFRLGSSQSTRAASEISPNPGPLLPASRAAPSRVFRLLRMATGKTPRKSIPLRCWGSSERSGVGFNHSGAHHLATRRLVPALRSRGPGTWAIDRRPQISRPRICRHFGGSGWCRRRTRS